jgi:peptidoglycan/LPS O-acetylase OafA/YrhL
MEKTTSRFPVLDLVRGAAALEVCANHVRRLLLQPYSDLKSPPLIDTGIYLATSFAHQAVVVFFVLSGFLIGGSVHQAWLANRWSWKKYGVQRLSRLWAVLVPCLVFTLLWDHVGAALSGGRGYDGTLADMMYFGIENNPPLDHSWPTVLGNLFFLQDIVTPMLGSNLALWSLANEFWYYVIFPLGFLALMGGVSKALRALFALTALLICAAMPHSVLEGGIVWLMGYGGWLITHHEKAARILRKPWVGGMLSAVLLVSLAKVKQGHWLASDYVLGACSSLLLPIVVSIRELPAWLKRISFGLSDISYSLYLSHFPILALLIFGVLKKDHLWPGVESYSLYLGLMALLVLHAYGVWFLFEKRTPALRKQMLSVVDRVSFGFRTPRESVVIPTSANKMP